MLVEKPRDDEPSVFSWVFTVVVFAGLVSVGWFTWNKRNDPPPGPGIRCLTNVKLLGMAQLMYAGDWDDKLPLGSVWMDDIAPYLTTPSEPARTEHLDAIFRCPVAQEHDPQAYGYAMNRALAGAKVGGVPGPENVVLLFESAVLSRNACTPFTGLPNPPRHRGFYVTMLDGSARRLQVQEVSQFDRKGRNQVPKPKPKP